MPDVPVQAAGRLKRPDRAALRWCIISGRANELDPERAVVGLDVADLRGQVDAQRCGTTLDADDDLVPGLDAQLGVVAHPQAAGAEIEHGAVARHASDPGRGFDLRVEPPPAAPLVLVVPRVRGIRRQEGPQMHQLRIRRGRLRVHERLKPHHRGQTSALGRSHIGFIGYKGGSSNAYLGRGRRPWTTRQSQPPMRHRPPIGVIAAEEAGAAQDHGLERAGEDDDADGEKRGAGGQRTRTRCGRPAGRRRRGGRRGPAGSGRRSARSRGRAVRRCRANHGRRRHRPRRRGVPGSRR